MKRIRTELKKNYKELYMVLKEENLLDWFEKVVRCNGSIEGALKKMEQVIQYQEMKSVKAEKIK